MNKLELETELKKLKAELEDLEETISFNLMHTGAHIPGRHVREDEERLNALKEEITKIEQRLNEG